MKLRYDLNNPYEGKNTRYGSIELEGGEIAHLTEMAYVVNYKSGTRYQAEAVSDKATYLVTWDVDCTNDSEDEEFACDWDSFEVKEEK